MSLGILFLYLREPEVHIRLNKYYKAAQIIYLCIFSRKMSYNKIKLLIIVWGLYNGIPENS